MLDLLQQIGPPFMITVLVPIIMAVVKWITPSIPKVLIPTAAALVGPALDQLAVHLAGFEGQGTNTAVLLGIAGVGVREIAKQLVPYLLALASKTSLRAVFLALAIGSGMLPLAACSERLSPQAMQEMQPRNAAEAVELAQTLYVEISAAAVQASRDGVITLDQLRTFQRYQRGVRAAIDAALAAAGTPDAERSAMTALAVTRELRALLLQLSGRRA